MSSAKFLVFLVLAAATSAKDCRFDDKKPWEDVENVYECKEKESCCTDAGRPSCCSKKDINIEVLEQFKLWGGLIGALVGVGILVACYRREKSICPKGKKCCGRRKEDELEYMIPPPVTETLRKPDM